MEIDSENIDFSAVNADGIVDAAELAGYVTVVDGVIQVDTDGGGDGFEAIVDTGAGAADDGVAVEVGGVVYVWNADAWVEA